MAGRNKESIGTGSTWEPEADYRKMIAEKVDRISNEKFLQFLYGLLESFDRKWGLG